jgi:hypothetical protein
VRRFREVDRDRRLQLPPVPSVGRPEDDAQQQGNNEHCPHREIERAPGQDRHNGGKTQRDPPHHVVAVEDRIVVAVPLPRRWDETT